MGLGSVVKSAVKSVASAVTSPLGGAGGIVTGLVANELLGKKPKVKADTSALRAEAAATANQRKNMFMTDYGVLGEEVDEVGKKKRGSIFGN